MFFFLFEILHYPIKKCHSHQPYSGWGGGSKWLLVLALLAHWCKTSSLYLESVPDYGTLTKTTPREKWFSWSNPYKIEVAVTCLRTARITKLWSHEKIYNTIWITWLNFAVDVSKRNYDIITFISKYRYFEKVWGSHFWCHHHNYNQVY